MRQENHTAVEMPVEDRAEAIVAFCDAPTEDRKGSSRGLSPRESWMGLTSTFDALVAAGAPRRELGAAWSFDLEACVALTAAISWAKNCREGTLVLSGSVGRGKTVAAARYALSTMSAWCHAPLLALDEWSKAAKRIDALLTAQHLVVDEVGGPGTTSGMAVARLSAILSSRHAAGKPTLITTNLPESEFARIYDGVKADESRLIDRINDAGSWVSCDRVHGPGDGKDGPGSFRVSGGCDYTRNRYADAKRRLQLLRAVESGDHRDVVLDELQATLECSEADLVRMLDKTRSSRQQVADIVQGFFDRVSNNEPKKSVRGAEEEDSRRRVELQTQAAGLGAQGEGTVS